MRDALNATGRPILFSLCGWRKWYGPVGASLGNMWRISPDVIDWFGVYRSAVTRCGKATYCRFLVCMPPDFLTHCGGVSAQYQPGKVRRAGWLE